MTDHQLLFFVVVLLYFSECLFWVGSQGIVFIKSSNEWKVTFPSSLFGNSNGGLALAWPFPPLGKVFLAYFLPVSFSERGIVNATIEGVGKITPILTHKLKFIHYENIQSVECKGAGLIVNGEMFCKCVSADQAIKLAKLIQDISYQNKKRGKVHRSLKSLFDIEQLKNAEDILKQQTQTLLWLCNFQFFFLLVIAPILVYLLGTRLLLWTGLYVIFSNLLIIVYFYLANQKMYPDQIGERVTDILKMVFCPPMTIRATDFLSLRYFTSFHPLAVARLVLSERKFEVFAKQILLSFNYPCDMIDDNSYREDLIWHLRAMEQNAKNFLTKNGMKISELEAAPEPSDGVASYCPRCHTQYTMNSGQCPECVGVALIEYTGKNDE